MLKLHCTTMNYAWGKRGDVSEVADLAAASGDSIDPQKHYAELWMGTHPTGHSRLAATGELLGSWLVSHPEALGSILEARFGEELPFLFKVLSIDTALSIQAHPDKTLAEELNASRPDIYRDANHKPEMALAMTDFEALCGFLPMKDILGVLKSFPELRACVGDALARRAEGASGEEEERAALRALFRALMSCTTDVVSKSVTQLVDRLGTESARRSLTLAERLVLRLHQQYPRDVGVLAALLLNHLQLTPGQALALPANEPHAYIHGNCIEVMATSDNVVRAGLTPKPRDVDTLCGMLSYSQAPPPILVGAPVLQSVVHRRQSLSNKLIHVLYSPPFDEFQLEFVCMRPGAKDYDVGAAFNAGPGILLVTKGAGHAVVTETGVLPAEDEGEEEGMNGVRGLVPGGSLSKALLLETVMKRGDVFFVAADTRFVLSVPENSEENLEMYYASCNERIFK